MYIVLVRHGETDFNKQEKIQGSEVDPPLNSSGKQQAIETGKFLKKIEKDNKKYNHLEKLIHIYDCHKVTHITKQESWLKIGERASKIINKIIDENYGDSILIVSHGSFIENAIRNLFKIRQIKRDTVGRSNCSITVIKINQDKTKELIMSYNNMHLSHLY